MHLPEDFVNSITRSCPNLDRIKLKFCTLAPQHLIELATECKSLHHISLGKCDAWFFRCQAQPLTFATIMATDEFDLDAFEDSHVSAADIVHFMADHLPHLQSLHLNQCVWNALPSTPDDEPLHSSKTGAQHPLASLKIFDTSAHLSHQDLVHFASRFPSLTSLRVDMDCATFYNPHEFAQSLTQLRRLELRGSKPHTSPEPILPHFPSSFNHLNTLSLWSAPLEFIHSLLHSPTSNILTSLSLNYCPNSESLPPTPLPSLTTLHLRHLGATAHTTCTNLLTSLTASSPRLTHLHLGSFQRNPNPFPPHTLSTLAQTCPRLQSLHLTNFEIGTQTWHHLTSSTVFPQLRILESNGCESVRNITATFEQDLLFPFIQSHKHLHTLRLNVGGISLQGIELGGQLDAGGVLELAVEGLGFSARAAVVRQTRVADMEGYKLYGRRIVERFRWVKEVAVTGPLGGVPLLAIE
ncbi:hypothetical protein HDU98_005221 [Podochytrium sp. JEL0797]|nr:hypothetical protein HDU98_005221 [Podochytrium sp. JEL0797]